MKVFAISGDAKYIKIGETFEAAQWFGFKEEIADQVAKVQKRDIVEIEYDDEEKNKRILTKITVTQSAEDKPTASTETGGKTKYEDKGVIITKLAVLKSATSAIPALAGQVTSENIAEETIKLYKALLEEVLS